MSFIVPVHVPSLPDTAVKIAGATHVKHLLALVAAAHVAHELWQSANEQNPH